MSHVFHFAVFEFQRFFRFISPFALVEIALLKVLL